MNQYSKETGRDIKITAYYDGMELIEKYDTTVDLIFLDIRMKLVNGLHAAERIRQMDERVGIIFLTTLTQYGLEGYKYQATNYIIKPLKYARLKSELNKFVERSQKEENPFLVIANDTGKYKAPLKSIRYIETYNRNLMFHTEQENIVCYKSMKEMERELCDKNFARCHTSYIVNLFYVKGIKMIQKETGGDLARIETVVPYDSDYSKVVDQGQDEVNRGYMPEIKPLDIRFEDYDRVILGTPVWWYTFAPAMHTFLASHDFSGKTVCPFVTNGGWIGHTLKDIAAACKGAKVERGLNIKFDGDKLQALESEIKKWIQDIG